MRTAVLLHLSLIVSLSAPAHACWYFPPTNGAAVSPAVPTSRDQVWITVSGEWPDSCTPRGLLATVDGNDIFLDVVWGHPANVLCLTVISPWSRGAMVGTLPPGVYNIHARLADHPLCGAEEYTFLRDFTVSDHQLILSSNVVNVGEGQTSEFTVRLLNPLGSVEVTTTVESGDADIAVQSGGTLAFDPGNYSRPQAVRIAAGQDADFTDGEASLLVSAPGFVTTVVTVIEDDDDRPEVLHVDAAATGADLGTSWSDALTDLPRALELAAQYPDIREIRVARGVYKPAPPAGNRNYSLRLADGLVLLGGYAGASGPVPGDRNLRAYETVLSGDLNGDDGADFAGTEDNSFSVVDGRGLGATTVLDGFTITAGDGGSTGGGLNLLRPASNMTVRNCLFTRNRSAYGGGVRIHDSSPTLINCVFALNETVPGRIHDGGGAYVAGESGAVFVNCTFIGNSAGEDGGGLCNLSAGTVAKSCIFWANRDGGGRDESAQVHGSGGRFDHCCVEGWTGALDGTESFGDDPLLIDTESGDYHLAAGSPCVDAGDPLFDEQPTAGSDIDGDPRVIGGRVDVGADERLEKDTGFRRGSSNDDGSVDVGDAIHLLHHLFAGGPAPACLKSADMDDTGSLQLEDAIYLLGYLFRGGPPPAAPFTACAADPTADALTCQSFPPCR